MTDIVARLDARGRVTLPVAVREALGLRAGDQILFRVEGVRAAVSRIPDLLELAGSVRVPPDAEGVPWEEVRRRARDAWVQEHASLQTAAERPDCLPGSADTSD